MLAICFGVEVLLRLLWGFGDPPLIYLHPEYAYAFQPNQNLMRLGNRIYYNSLGLRSNEVSVPKQPNTVRILCLGDSVTNGGAVTDQSDTYPEVLKTMLEERDVHSEVLNASAGGWAIENELAFLSSLGVLNSDVLVLQIGTHDLVQRKALERDIVNDVNFPTRRPLLAIGEVVSRYLLPRLNGYITKSGLASPPTLERPSMGIMADNLRVVQHLVHFGRSAGAKVYILFTPNADELYPPSDAASQREQSLREFRERGFEVVDALPSLRGGCPIAEDCFRDVVHLNPRGNQVIARVLAIEITRSRE